MSHHQPQRVGAFYLDQSSLQCKAGCGFFGNPEWLGYCSMCFKQLNNYHQQQQQQQQQQQLQPNPQFFINPQPIRVPYQPYSVSYQQTQPYQHQFYYPQQPLPQPQPQIISPLTEDPQTPKSTPTSVSQPTTPNIQSLSLKDSPSNETLNNTDQASTSGFNTSNTSSLLNNLTSPTSLVMMGYDTLTNLHHTIINTAKSSFRASPSASADVADSSSIHSTSQSEYHMRPKSSRKQWPNIMHNASIRRGSLDQAHFLYDVAWADCLRLTNKFAKELLAAEKRIDKTINDLSDMVHDFYEKMAHHFDTQFVYKGASADQLELLNDNMERILNEHIYQAISARIVNEDEDHIMAIQKRIKSLNWITVEHLEIEIDFQRPAVHDLLDKAICQMVELNSRSSSIDKLECIVQCSKTIFELLQVGPPSGNSSIPVSADQFLPVLVFVVIQANPPMLPADMKYLNRFSNPRRLMSGETGYYFTNLCCALEFIEKTSGASLNISEEEFKRYLNGEAVPQTKSQFDTYLCDGLRTMCSNDASLKKLRHQNELRNTKIDNLMEQIDVHLETTRAKLKEMQAFAANLEERLKPNLPKFYLELKAKNKDFAARLLPSHLRQSI